MRTIQRMMKRSGLPVVYSQGFNPHINLSLAQPLAVGVYSGGDYFDAPMEEDVEESAVKEAMNRVAPPGIKILEVSKIRDEENKKVFKSMAAIDAASYRIKLRYRDASLLEKEMDALLEKKEWTILKKSKSGEKVVDIKPLVRSIDFRIVENILVVEAVVSCGSKDNLSPELLAQLIKDSTSSVDEDAFIDIKRNEMYADVDGKLVPLFKYIKTI
ncbi:MAG: radical protein [Firmicutes bacterium]|nr:radical protein [Bacillota bacterium]